MQVCNVVGARPNFIKAAPVIRALAAAEVDSSLLHTGQHYDRTMSDDLLFELDLPRPHQSLGIGSGPHGAQTGKMLAGIEEVLVAERPAVILVYGDTNSSLAGALAGVKLHIPVAHVEAGLRSFNRKMPEEVNRILIDHASDLLLAPTRTAVENLRREGCGERTVHVGDVMYDAALQFADRAARTSDVLDRHGLEPKGYVLASVHRAENTDDPRRLAALFGGLARVARELPVVLPLHPRTRKALAASGQLAQVEAGLLVTEPAGYLDMLLLERHAALVATDSGGVQKEAYFQRVPCVTLRAETEWVELVEMGWNHVVAPVASDAVYAGVMDALAAGPGQTKGAPYGDGHAAEKIVDAVVRRL